MPGSFGRVPESRVAASVAALYALVAGAALAYPVLSGSDLAGVWSILLTLPWSAVFPLGTVNRLAPGLAGPLRFLFLLAATLGNAVLIYLGLRWAGRWAETHRR